MQDNFTENEAILKRIFSYIPTNKFLSITLVCKKWKLVADNDERWLSIFKNQFPVVDHSMIPSEEKNNWKQRYREMKEGYRRLKNPIETPITLVSNNERPNSLKIICLGSIKVGKSTFVKRWVDREWTGEYYATNGTSCHFFNYQNFNIEIWDTSGAARYDSILPIYIKDSVIVLIFYSVGDSFSFERVKLLYNTAKQHSKNALIGIIATKTDLPDNLREVSSKYAFSFCEEKDLFYWEVDNTMQTQVDQILNDLVCWIKIYTKIKNQNTHKQDNNNCIIN